MAYSTLACLSTTVHSKAVMDAAPMGEGLGVILAFQRTLLALNFVFFTNAELVSVLARLISLIKSEGSFGRVAVSGSDSTLGNQWPSPVQYVDQQGIVLQKVICLQPTTISDPKV